MVRGRVQVGLARAVGLLLGLLWAALVAGDEFPTCGDCWCVPDNDGLAACPADNKPQTEFSATVINVYKNQSPRNAYELYCNPYSDAACTTTPPQIMTGDADAVCALHYDDVAANNNNKTLSASCSTYSLITYSSRAEAETAGDTVTHLGSCGLCSTTQDLAIYLSKFV
jgi:hypothetical protein